MLAGFIFQYVERVEYTPNFKPVTSWRRIGSRYLRGWAAIEVLSLGVPFDPRVSRALALEIISLLKLLRMLRLFRVRARREKRLTAIGRAEVIWHTKIISISHLLIVFLLWGHVAGCVYWWVSLFEKVCQIPGGSKAPRVPPSGVSGVSVVQRGCLEVAWHDAAGLETP